MENKKELMVNTNELSVSDVKTQIDKIQELMKSVMIKDEHYGIIPGTQKNTLLKAGAEKLGLVFRLVPEYNDPIPHDLGNDHREFIVICTLRHIDTEKSAGQGLGSCSTKEKKYRWRNEYSDEIVGDLPGAYWQVAKNKKAQQAFLQQRFGQGFFKAKKGADNKWVVTKSGEAARVENPDIADTYNTVLKMAKKRAHVDAMITACAASDIFTQDIETAPSVPPQPEGPPAKPAKTEIPQASKDLANELHKKMIAAVKFEIMSAADGKKLRKEIERAAHISISKLKEVGKKMAAMIPSGPPPEEEILEVSGQVEDVPEEDPPEGTQELPLDDPGINQAFDTSGGITTDAPLF